MRGQYNLHQPKDDTEGEHLEFKCHCCPNADCKAADIIASPKIDDTDGRDASRHSRSSTGAGLSHARSATMSKRRGDANERTALRRCDTQTKLIRLSQSRRRPNLPNEQDHSTALRRFASASI